jgi:hypothetical protein
LNASGQRICSNPILHDDPRAKCIEKQALKRAVAEGAEADFERGTFNVQGRVAQIEGVRADRKAALKTPHLQTLCAVR